MYLFPGYPRFARSCDLGIGDKKNLTLFSYYNLYITILLGYQGWQWRMDQSSCNRYLSSPKDSCRKNEATWNSELLNRMTCKKISNSLYGFVPILRFALCMSGRTHKSEHRTHSFHSICSEKDNNRLLPKNTCAVDRKQMLSSAFAHMKEFSISKAVPAILFLMTGQRFDNRTVIHRKNTFLKQTTRQVFGKAPKLIWESR